MQIRSIRCRLRTIPQTLNPKPVRLYREWQGPLQLRKSGHKTPTFLAPVVHDCVHGFLWGLFTISSCCTCADDPQP